MIGQIGTSEAGDTARSDTARSADTQPHAGHATQDQPMHMTDVSERVRVVKGRD